jgi:LysM repeat protein
MATKPETSAGEEKREKKRKESLFCPFIGFEDDPSTALAYPAKYNFCFHARPVSPVSLVYQRNKCLTEHYADCPVFLNENPAPLPKGIRGERISRIAAINWLSITALIAVLIIGLAATILTGIIPIPGFEPPLAGFSFATRTPALQPEVLPSQEPTLTPEPTATLMPTPTATWVIPVKITPRALETPFGSSPQLVIHKVAAGEGFILLAENFNTTAEAIKAINFELPESLWENTILVIPINTDDVTALPQFDVAEIRAEGMTIETYAERMQVDVELLKKYNDLPEGYTLKMGELLIVPMTD